MTPRKQKLIGKRHSGHPWKPKGSWKPEQIGEIVTVSGMFVEQRPAHPFFPRLLLVSKVSARILAERECVFLFAPELRGWMPCEWHARANPRVKAYLTKNFLLDLRKRKERIEDREVPAYTETIYHLD